MYIGRACKTEGGQNSVGEEEAEKEIQSDDHNANDEASDPQSEDFAESQDDPAEDAETVEGNSLLGT